MRLHNTPVNGSDAPPDRPGRQLRLGLVGVGALGSEIARQIAATPALALRVASVTLYDPDVLEARNIPASRLFAEALYRDADLCGQPKVDVVAAQGSRLAPCIGWIARRDALDEVGWQDLQQLDLLVTATDNLPSRVFAAHACRMLRLAMLDAGVHGAASSTGRIAFFPATPAEACYACTLTATTRAAAIRSLHWDPEGCRTLPAAALMDDSFQTATALTQTAAAAMAILAHFSGGTTQSAFALQVGGDAAAPLALTRSQDCPWHRAESPLRPIAEAVPLAAQLDSEELFLLPAPLYAGARCRVCAQTSDWIALASRWSAFACGHCGTAGEWEPSKVLSVVGKKDEAARQTPDELLLPSRHLLPVRTRIQRHWTGDTL